MTRPSAIRIAEGDNVAVALRVIAAGESVSVGGESVTARQEVPAGHKIALASLEPVFDPGTHENPTDSFFDPPLT